MLIKYRLDKKELCWLNPLLNTIIGWHNKLGIKFIIKLLNCVIEDKLDTGILS